MYEEKGKRYCYLLRVNFRIIFRKLKLRSLLNYFHKEGLC